METMETDIPMDAEVHCSDGPCGRSTGLIINPADQEITHIVVKTTGRSHAERLIPIDWVVKTSHATIYLCCTQHELAEEDLFVEEDFVPVEIPRYVGSAYVAYPFITNEVMNVRVKHEHVPPGEVAVRRGAHVVATDGPVGRVDGFLIDPSTDRVTHLVLREGHLWGARDVSIPVSAIDHLEEEKVYLNLDKHSIGALSVAPMQPHSH